jgi:signal transduction histidine kinase
VTSSARPPRTPIREILVRVFHPPVRERAFWAVQAMVVFWAFVHIEADLHSFENGILPTGAPLDLLLVPVGYAALRYGLSGGAATAVWAALLWLPDLVLSDNRGHPYQDLIQLAVVIAIALFVGFEIERAHLERARAEAAEADRRAAEVHYHQLFDTNTSPILLVDPVGVVAEANPAAVALWGIAVGSSTEDLLGMGSEDLVEGRSSETVRLELESGEERDYRLSVSHLGTGGDGSLRQVVLEDVTEEYLAGSEARAWAGEVLRAQEDERRRIAREIHDDPLQRLLQLARRMEALGSPASSAEEAERLGAAREELLDVVAHLRDVARGLRPAGLDQLGLVAAVRGLLADIENEEGLTTEFAVTGEVARGTPETEVGVFRIVQEAVRNVVRHAGANRLSVELAYDKGVVRMIVTDDGRGFDHAGAARPVAGSHLGILGMRERASLLDGHCDVLSAPGHGTVVEATVPLHRAPGNRAARTTGNRTFTPIAR